MDTQEQARIKQIGERAARIGGDERLCALFDLADRISVQALRRGCFEIGTSRLTGAFEAWGFFLRDLKRVTDAGADAARINGLRPPPVPADIDADLRPSVRGFAGLAGVAVPGDW